MRSRYQPGEEVERVEHLLALGAAARALAALLRLARSLGGQRLLLGLGLDARPALLRELGDAPRGRARVERRVEVDGAGQLDQAVAPLPGVRVEQALGAVEAPGGDARERVERLALEPARGEERLDRALREPAEGDELAARPDRRRQEAELVRDEDDDGIRRRLLEVLEERVGSVLVQQVRAEDEVDAALGLERAHVQVAAELADRVDPDLVAERLEHVEVGMDTAADAVGVAQKLGGEGERGAALPDPARPVEEVRVRRPFGQRGAEEALGLVLLREGLEAVHGRSRRYLRG